MKAQLVNAYTYTYALHMLHVLFMKCRHSTLLMMEKKKFTMIYS